MSERPDYSVYGHGHAKDEQRTLEHRLAEEIETWLIPGKTIVEYGFGTVHIHIGLVDLERAIKNAKARSWEVNDG